MQARNKNTDILFESPVPATPLAAPVAVSMLDPGSPAPNPAQFVLSISPSPVPRSYSSTSFPDGWKKKNFHTVNQEHQSIMRTMTYLPYPALRQVASDVQGPAQLDQRAGNLNPNHSNCKIRIPL